MEESHALTAREATARSAAGIRGLWIVAFAALTSIGAQIEIPHQPVPYTMQTLLVLLSGALLGARVGAASQLVYLAAGAIGLPVFAQFGFGIARLLGPTGGYLLAFPVAAFVVGYLTEQRRTFVWSLVAMSVGLFVVFSLGTMQLQLVYFHDWSEAFRNGFLIFSWWDLTKLAAAAVIAHRIGRRIV